MGLTGCVRCGASPISFYAADRLCSPCRNTAQPAPVLIEPRDQDEDAAILRYARMDALAHACVEASARADSMHRLDAALAALR